MLRRTLRLLILSSALFPLFAPSVVSAQTGASQKAAAEALFDDGLKLMKSARFAEACPKLEDSQRIDPGIGTLLYLGECYEKLGRTASAWATFREAASNAGAAGQADRERNAKDRAARLESKLSYVTLRAPREVSELRGIKARLGNAEVGAGVFGIATPIDPGESRVEVSAEGYDSFAVTLHVEPGKRYEVAIPPLRQQPAAVTSSPPPSADPPPPLTTGSAPVSPPPPPLTPMVESKPDSGMKTFGLILGGVGVVGLGVGSYFGVKAISKMDEAKEGTCVRSVCQEPADQERTEDANSAATISNIAFVAGGASLVTGALLFFLAPGSRETGLRATPYASHDQVGIAVGGRL
jgi:serine/threonine-protein kinase